MDRNLNICLCICLSLLFGISSNVESQAYHGEPELIDGEPFSLPYEGQVLWIRRYHPPTESHQHLSAVRINKRCGITAGHAFIDQGYEFTDHVVGNGTNWMTDKGQMRNVVEYEVHPSWLAVNGFWNGDAVDLATICWDQDLHGDDLEIGTLSIDEVFEYAGFGRPAIEGQLFDFDGQRRAWEAGAHAWGSGAGTISTDYVRSRFRELGHPTFLPMGGIVTGGSSGSPGFNSLGELVALAVYGQGSPNYLGASYGIRLELYQDWIESRTALPPDPPTFQVSKHAVRFNVLSKCRIGQNPC